MFTRTLTALSEVSWSPVLTTSLLGFMALMIIVTRF